MLHRWPKAHRARQPVVSRLVALEGKHLLGQARRQESKSAQKDLTAQAGKLFKEAATQLKGATAEIDKRLGQLATPASDDEKAQKADLTRAKLQAQLDEAINLINQSNTLIETRDAKDRAKVVAEAKDLLVNLSKADDDNPLSWQAKVWLGRLAEEIVPVGSLNPDCIHLPSIYVKRMIVGAPYEKKIEFRTTRQREAA